MKKLPTKLKLHRETILLLDQLSSVAGGVTIVCGTKTCTTDTHLHTGCPSCAFGCENYTDFATCTC